MAEIESTDILIIGSGPAGISTALHLAQMDENFARRMMVVDKAVHPREKLCGGGVTQPGLKILDGLGLSIPVPKVPIQELRFQVDDMVFAVRDEPVFTVIRRDEFDHWLVREAEARGISVRQGEAVTAIHPEADGVTVTTEQRTIRAKIVVIADGSKSACRRMLGWESPRKHPPVARLLEVLTPETPDEPLFAQGVAVFDFSAQLAGVQGYVWDFPSLKDGHPVMNRGVFDSRARPERPRIRLKEILAQALAQRGRDLSAVPLKGHPIQWFDGKLPLSRPRVLLAGDAAGVDPFVGEGISFALRYGKIAAETIAAACARNDFSLADYGRRVRGDSLLGTLPLRVQLARWLYRLQAPWAIRVAWRLLPVSARVLGWIRPEAISFSPRISRIK